MIINNKNYDSIEIFDATGQLIAMVSDGDIVTKNGARVNFSENDKMFKGEEIDLDFVARPLMKYLNEKYDVHCSAFVDCTKAEIVRGEEACIIEDYLKD